MKRYEYYCESCQAVYELKGEVRSICSLCGQGLFIREAKEGKNDT